MALSSGTTLGVYEILDALGVGGMGEVYRARDTKLGRAVAIKILPDAFAADPERIARFEREAKVLASLNHPHIAALFGMEEAAGRHFLIMELVEGETLAERLERGPLPVEDALRVAHQTADALEAAHDTGIVHRDLKPANIKITRDEKVKVLDFGLAKAMDPASARADGATAGQAAVAGLTHSPTLSLMATQAGMIFGTAAYMSPEQAKGLPADHRSDIFSFGVVLFEMLTGRQPFRGETAPDVLASVLVREADLASLPERLNPRLLDLLRRCLEKNPKKRWQAVGDLRAEIETIQAAPHAIPAAVRPSVDRPIWKRAAPAVAAAAIVSALTGAIVWNVRPRVASPVVARFSIPLGENQQLTASGLRTIAISPDGTQIAYTANNRLFLRSLGDLDAKPITGIEAGTNTVAYPIFSPEGRSIAFFSSRERALKSIAVSGGAAVTVCETAASAPSGMSWNEDFIVFGQPQGFMRVPATGGKPELIVRLKSDEVAYGPQILPGGEQLLFALTSGSTSDRWDKAQVVVQSIKSGERRVLIAGGSDARYLPTGHIVYALGGMLYAAPFDAKRLEITGGATPVVVGIRRPPNPGVGSGAANFSFSDTGTLIYVPGPVGVPQTDVTFSFIDRQGNFQPLKLPPGAYENPRLSPDGKRLAYDTDDGKEAIVWIYDLSDATAPRRLTFGGNNRYPIWSEPDGQWLAFQSDREGDRAIFRQRADGSGIAERLTKPDGGVAHIPESWSPNGKVISFSAAKNAVFTLWTLSLDDHQATRFDDVESKYQATSTFSPDGRWLAYVAFTGNPTVFVQPFPPTGARYQAPDDGLAPKFSRNGKELFYDPSGPGLVAAAWTTQPAVAFGTPAAVPTGGFAYRPGGPMFPRSYDIGNDGRLIAVGNPAASTSGADRPTEIRVVLNWFQDVREKVSVAK